MSWVREIAPGITGIQVLEIAQNEYLVVITFDKHFGELAFRQGLPASCRIILCRISRLLPGYVKDLAVSAIQDRRDEWVGHFRMIEDDRIRVTPLEIPNG